MKPILLLMAVLTTTVGVSQAIVKFDYDTSGNHIKRYEVCIICSKAETVELEDKNETLEEASREIAEQFELTVYPNPMTNVLMVRWVENNERQPERFTLFSMSGRLLATHHINKSNGQYPLDVSSFPAGSYLLTVFYNDTKETFQLIKK